MKIAVAGLGYVGLSNAVLLAQNNTVVALDLSQTRVDMVNARKTPIVDPELEQFLRERELTLAATTDPAEAYQDAEFVIVATPTNYDPETSAFDTASVEAVIASVQKIAPSATVVVKSTIPVGFVAEMRAQFNTQNIFFRLNFCEKAAHFMIIFTPAELSWVIDLSRRADSGVYWLRRQKPRTLTFSSQIQMRLRQLSFLPIHTSRCGLLFLMSWTAMRWQRTWIPAR